MAGGGVQPGEGGGQVVQRAGVLQLVAAAQVCHNTMADLAGIVAVALHDVHVLVDPTALPHFLHSYVHFPNTLRPVPTQRADIHHPWLISFPTTDRRNEPDDAQPQAPHPAKTRPAELDEPSL